MRKTDRDFLYIRGNIINNVMRGEQEVFDIKFFQNVIRDIGELKITEKIRIVGGSAVRTHKTVSY